MPSVTLKAHYDGERIVLDEPFELPPHAKLAVTVLAPDAIGNNEEHSGWIALSLQNLARAYGDEEPAYTLDDIQP